VTGAEAIYADMGHFGRKAITRAWLGLAFPCLVLNYLGQGALLMSRPGTASNPFFYLVPGGQTGQKLMVVLATVATVIASQAVISGAFSVTQQAMQLGFLPRMSIRHTSRRIMGQIYIPAVNWFLLAAVLVLVLAFRSPTGLANAYGIALSAIFASNTFLAFVVFRKIWGKPLWMVIPGAAFFISVELLFFAANLPKVASGGWLPLAVGGVFFVILSTWRRGRLLLAAEVREDRVSLRRYLNDMIDRCPPRVPGTAVVLTPSLETVPPAFLNNAEHNHVVHERVVMLQVDMVGVPHVSESDRVTVEWLRLGFVTLRARYGYQDTPDLAHALELARAAGLEVDPQEASFFVSHATILPTGESHMAHWRKRLFAFLHQNSIPAARYYHLPPDRVFDVGAFVEI
jgi:KUP system potassium uptake protein